MRQIKVCTEGPQMSRRDIGKMLEANKFSILIRKQKMFSVTIVLKQVAS